MVLVGLAQPATFLLSYSSDSLALATTASVHNKSDTFIEISDNSDFTLYGFSGNGSMHNPYLLENQEIDFSLYIHNTTAYFLIRNCNISVEALACEWISNGAIEECSFASSSALYIHSSRNVNVSENAFNSTGYSEALWMLDCKDSIVSENEFLSCDAGLNLMICNNTIISNNHFINDNHGLILDSSAWVTVIGNEFEGCGLEIQFLNYVHNPSYSFQELVNLPYNITNNLVNGKDVGFFQSLSNVEVNLAQYGQAILLSCNDTLISGGDFQNCTIGVQIIHSNNCTIDGTTVSNCSWTGIDIQDSLGITLRDCRVVKSQLNGVSLSKSPFFTFIYCVIENNLGSGINPYYLSSNGTVVSSIIRGNHWTGLFLSSNTTVIGNTVTRNGEDGIHIFGSYCLVCNNTVTYNNSTGIRVEERDGTIPVHNRIYNNSIGWNEYLNAIDYGYDNSWDDGSSIGNSWSDYYGIGVYEIEWYGTDHYPSILPKGDITLFQLHIIVICALAGVSVIVISIPLKRRIRT